MLHFNSLSSNDIIDAGIHYFILPSSFFLFSSFSPFAMPHYFRLNYLDCMGKRKELLFLLKRLRRGEFVSCRSSPAPRPPAGRATGPKRSTRSTWWPGSGPAAPTARSLRPRCRRRRLRPAQAGQAIRLTFGLFGALGGVQQTFLFRNTFVTLENVKRYFLVIPQSNYAPLCASCFHVFRSARITISGCTYSSPPKVCACRRNNHDFLPH